jgi:beta-lactamase superfamily II metal-dependent hydrolase
MRAVAPDPEKIVIAAWFVSHPHEDHQFGYEEFLSNHSAEDVTLERLVFNYGPSKLYNYKRHDGQQEKCADFVERIYTLTAAKFPETQIVKAHTGQVMSFGSVDVEILFTVEDLMPTDEFDYVNSTSMVIRIFCEEQSILLLADTTHKSGKIIEDTYGDHLRSTMVQLAHHGLAPSYASLYEKIQAKVLIWPSIYSYASENYQLYNDPISKALSYASDVYLADFEDGYTLTLKLPYTAINNKEAVISKLVVE